MELPKIKSEYQLVDILTKAVDILTKAVDIDHTHLFWASWVYVISIQQLERKCGVFFGKFSRHGSFHILCDSFFYFFPFLV